MIYDFNGAGRFIGFVYLVGNDDSAVLRYVNDYLESRAVSPMRPLKNFTGLNWMDLPKG